MAQELLSPASGAFTYPCDVTGYIPQFQSIEDVLGELPADITTCTSSDSAFVGRPITELYTATKGRNPSLVVGRSLAHLRHFQAVHSYTVECGLYKHMNKSMREGNRSYLETAEFRPYCDYMLLLRKALTCATPLDSSVDHLYRGISVPIGEDCYRQGETITWQAFSSTTRDLGVAIKFLGGEATRPTGTLFSIVNCSLAKGIAHWSQYPEEEEWLYAPNAQFKVADRLAASALTPEIARFWKKGTDPSGVRVIVLMEI